MNEMEKRSALLGYFQHDAKHEPEECLGPCRDILNKAIEPKFPEVLVFQYQNFAAPAAQGGGER